MGLATTVVTVLEGALTLVSELEAVDAVRNIEDADTTETDIGELKICGIACAA